MARQRRLPGRYLALFQRWLDSRGKTRLRPSTIDSYASDVTSFLVWLGKRELSTVSSSLMAEFFSNGLRPSRRGRMLAALSDFLAFAFEQQIVAGDPLRSLKYRRTKYADPAQLSFLDVLSKHLKRPSVEQLVWADFVDPLLKRDRMSLRVGNRTVQLPPRIWNRLDAEFRDLSRRYDLASLLKKKIA